MTFFTNLSEYNNRKKAKIGQMRLIVYADILFAVNFLMDTITLFVCSRVLSLRPKWYRTVSSALLGGIYCVIGLYINLPEPITAVLVSVAMCLVCFGRTDKLLFAKILLLFYAVGMLSGGIITFFYNMFYKYRGADLFKHGLSFKTFLLFSALSLVFMFTVSHLFSLFTVKKTVQLTVETEKENLSFTLLCDSGNLLFDPYSTLPVIIIKADCLDRVFGKNGVHKKPENNTEDAVKYKLRYIPVRTVAGSVVMPAFIMKNINITRCGTRKKSVSAVIASDISSGADYGGFDGVIPYTLCQ